MRANAIKRSSGLSSGLVQPIFAIHPKADVNAGIFARLDQAIEAELAALVDEPVTEDNILLQAFFNWALHKLDADIYALIQNKYIDMKGPGVGSNLLKYLSFTHYVRSKMPQFHRLALHKGPPKRILDIGCGPGHFQVLARHFGHEAIGLDLPLENRPHASLYDDLCKFFGVSKVDYRIEPMRPLPKFSDRFDLVTVFSTQFDFDLEQRPWNVRAWRAIVDDVCDNLLTPDGSLYLTLTSRERPKEVWHYLESVSEWTHNNRVAMIRRTRTRKSVASKDHVYMLREESRRQAEQFHDIEEQLREQLSERDGQIRHLENSLTEKITKQKAKIHRLGERLRWRDQQIGQMKSSVSWRVTAPLRWLKPKLQKARPNARGALV